MPDLSFGGLWVVAIVAFVVPLALGLAPAVRLPSVVLEIVAGIVAGPSVLGWARPDPALQVLSLLGLAFLLFLAGLEIDVRRLGGRVLRVSGLAFAASFGLALLVGYGLRAAGQVQQPLFLAIVLSATALGVVIPVLKDARALEAGLGQVVVAGASIAEFAAIILLSLFFSRHASGAGAQLFLLGGIALAAVGAGALIAGIERSMRLSPVLVRLQDTTGADQGARRLPAAGHLRGDRPAPRPGDHPRRVHRRRAADAAGPGSADDPPGIPHQAGGDRLRRVRAHLSS